MPTRKPKAAATAEAVLGSHSPEVRAMVDRLRAIIKTVAPQAVKSANASWHSLSYHHPEAGYFCGIFPFADYVRLVFEWGVLLPDPSGLLENGGRQVKYLPVRRIQDIRARPLKALLRAALALPSKRSAKVALLRAGAQIVMD